jgi:hypothetical protein
MKTGGHQPLRPRVTKIKMPKNKNLSTSSAPANVVLKCKTVKNAHFFRVGQPHLARRTLYPKSV